MKRSFLLLLALSALMISCHTPSYTFDRASNRYLKFPEGKYLLNTIEAPESVRLKMQEMVLDNFNEHIEESKLITLQEAPVSIFPSEIILHPDRETIKQLDESTGNFGFLINIKTEIVSDDVGSIQIGNLEDSEKNTVKVGMEIIDLTNHTPIFYSQVRAHLSTRNDTKDFAFAADTQTMLRKSLKRILRRIRKNTN